MAATPCWARRGSKSAATMSSVFDSDGSGRGEGSGRGSTGPSDGPATTGDAAGSSEDSTDAPAVGGGADAGTIDGRAWVGWPGAPVGPPGAAVGTGAAVQATTTATRPAARLARRCTVTRGSRAWSGRVPVDDELRQVVVDWNAP